MFIKVILDVVIRNAVKAPKGNPRPKASVTNREKGIKRAKPPRMLIRVTGNIAVIAAATGASKPNIIQNTPFVTATTYRPS